ncbi:mCG141256 [Mus musculus]|nr:mCG141256 [Mus musculus]
MPPGGLRGNSCWTDENLWTWLTLEQMRPLPSQRVLSRKIRALRTDRCSIRGWPSESSLTQKSPTYTCSDSVPLTSEATYNSCHQAIWTSCSPTSMTSSK